MKVLLVGLGTVGEAIARLSVGRPWLELMVLADHDLDRARRIAEEIGDDSTHPAAQVDASDERAVEALRGRTASTWCSTRSIPDS